MNTDIYSRILIAVVLLSATFAEPLLLAQQSTSNYVMKTTHINPDSTAYARQEIRYHDGLGRPVQTLRRHAATNADDLVDLTEYDSLGRASRTWSPVAIWAAGGQLSTELLTSAAQSYYDDECPFSETLYDGSPLDRVRKVTGPGEAWHLAGKGVKSNYYTNAESVGTDSLHCIRFGFSLSGNTGITFTRDNLWPAGSLMVERTEDEDGRTLWVFKDMRDQVVLERRLAEAATNSAGAVYADTYYLYDDAGRLTAVLPPELSAYFGWGNWPGISETDPKVEGFAFQYRYDARGRMIAKKLPGAAWTYYIYDKGDRLVLTQDGNQRERGEWSFRLQDALGRECLTGIMAGSYDAFADPLGSVQVRAIRNHGDGDYGSLHDYSVEGLSLPADAEALTVNWWDDYSFLGHESGMCGSLYGYTAPAATEPYSARYETSAAGLQTGHWSRTLGEVRQNVGPAVMEAWYYDDHGRVVYHVKGYPSGRRVQERSGYDFVGNLTALGRTMYDGSGAEEHTEAYAYQYDNWGRLQNTTHALDGGMPVTLTNNTYDSVGRLNGTTRGAIGATQGPASLSSSYAYNVRDWLTGIGGSLFSETLTYETPRTGSTLLGQWGGNISSSKWRIDPLSSDATWYDYAYDPLGRLTEAAYGSDVVSQNDYSRTYSYDLNGNPNGRETASYSEQWTAASGNAPAAWIRTRTSPFSILLQEGYAYDAAGNRTAVLDALGDTLNVMAYNLLNLPKEYVVSAGDVVKYVYSADGEKLYVQQTTSANVSTGTEYAANYRLEDGSLTMIHTDAGYYTPVTPPSGAGNPTYEHIWYLKDHLGNNRVLADGSGNALKIHHYDPFGIQIAVAGGTTTSFPSGATESPYKYGGKEWNTTTSTYDFEARQMAPAFHRFTTMDPLAEKYYSISPYAYCASNPVNLIDPDGMQWYLCTLEGGKTEYVYSEGAMSDDDKKKYKSVEDKGYFFRDPNTNIYYSLFGVKMLWDQNGTPTMAQFWNVVDRLIKTFFTDLLSEEDWTYNKCLTYIESLPCRIYNSNEVYYKGKNFSTLRNQDLPGSDSYLHTTFNNIPYFRAAIFHPDNLPLEPQGSGSYVSKEASSYWLKAYDPQKGNTWKGEGGFLPLQLEFDKQNARNFLKACVNLFPNALYSNEILKRMP